MTVELGNALGDYLVSMHDQIRELEEALRVTRSLVCEGAIVGFNPLDGDWCDRLYSNNGAISKLVPVTR
jgi:hypothetical protein